MHADRAECINEQSAVSGRWARAVGTGGYAAQERPLRGASRAKHGRTGPACLVLIVVTLPALPALAVEIELEALSKGEGRAVERRNAEQGWPLRTTYRSELWDAVVVVLYLYGAAGRA